MKKHYVAPEKLLMLQDKVRPCFWSPPLHPKKGFRWEANLSRCCRCKGRPSTDREKMDLCYY